ncbi:MAG: carboxymuconolactone decarboxylase family protein [Pseudanabaena sp.]|jgi:AhpD family alkylhydroperoxidase|uniref:carboxymuconolactone decarboxylase family protein n=1 Tax=Pseudanabaena mucicola TaxID=71190 RepID=UPI00257857C5|nr:carboxymuconolactone decarboxylase family protein [Pseudanabaena mucicola]MCE2974773.1 carboxymuconolactone decarboxylase family protein [Pseudanabaena sp. CoA8_M7]
MSESTTKHSYADQMKHIRSYTGKLSTAIPEVMKDFYALSKASSASGVIDSKTKELIALAIAVAIHCDDCIAFHTNSALHAGATKEEITEVLGVAIFMGGGPALMYATHVMAAIDELQQANS